MMTELEKQILAHLSTGITGTRADISKAIGHDEEDEVAICLVDMYWNGKVTRCKEKKGASYIYSKADGADLPVKDTMENDIENLINQKKAKVNPITKIKTRTQKKAGIKGIRLDGDDLVILLDTKIESRSVKVSKRQLTWIASVLASASD